jgi:hypothetical protein
MARTRMALYAVAAQIGIRFSIHARRVERRADAPPAKTPREKASEDGGGVGKMKQMTRRAAGEVRQMCRGRGHSEVPFAERGESPWREIRAAERPAHAARGVHAATGTAAAFLYRADELGTLRPGLTADLWWCHRADPLKDIRAVRKVERSA